MTLLETDATITVNEQLHTKKVKSEKTHGISKG